MVKVCLLHLLEFLIVVLIVYILANLALGEQSDLSNFLLPSSSLQGTSSTKNKTDNTPPAADNNINYAYPNPNQYYYQQQQSSSSSSVPFHNAQTYNNDNDDNDDTSWPYN